MVTLLRGYFTYDSDEPEMMLLVEASAVELEKALKGYQDDVDEDEEDFDENYIVHRLIQDGYCVDYDGISTNVPIVSYRCWDGILIDKE